MSELPIKDDFKLQANDSSTTKAEAGRDPSSDATASKGDAGTTANNKANNSESTSKAIGQDFAETISEHSGRSTPKDKHADELLP